MALNLQDKKTIVTEVHNIAKNALSAVTANTCGISVNKINELRKSGRKANVYIRVTRNTLLRRSIENTQFKCLNTTLTGPTLIAYSMEHPGTAARLFKEFAKTNVNFKIKDSAFENELISSDLIDRLANIPTYHEAIIRLVITIKEAAAGKLLRTFVALRNQKEANTS
ncbi:50S ribosomal protein L10 [Candidatus Erwinia haradaeae]|uniref:Large ribosomal subunit protein uL10 n=1 Tax=Candidatus Erwinia haradaeae TaxID=1922217 RepID=A0A451CZF7_9GAMM|nr:50S ribosomal protein L10 [Candidatus Erwinia haradaeae]VFP78785.1 50S ribosomal protein L10 [Candidatus Erwinia haradaeae]